MYFYSCIAFIQVEMHLLEGPDYGHIIVEEDCERKEEVHCPARFEPATSGSFKFLNLNSRLQLIICNHSPHFISKEMHLIFVVNFINSATTGV